MEGNLVSCIIPAYNAEPFIGEAVESILGQTHSAVEIVVVDDGSTDRTADVMRSYGTRLAHVYQPHRGTGAAQNTGVRIARGTYIAFLDADDLWLPEKLTRQMARLAQRPEIDLCFTQYQNFWTPALAEEEQVCQGRSLSRPSSGWSISTMLARRDIFERFGFFEEDVAGKHQNLLWTIRAAEQGGVVDVVPEILMYRRLHPGNLSRGWRIDDEFFRLVRAWRDYRGTQPKADDVHEDER